MTLAYSDKCHAEHPTYIGCSVAPEWHSFMTFRSWMMKQDWEGMHLDKDILVPGNKVYGPETCVFVDQATNNLLVNHPAKRGEYLIGVSWQKGAGKFEARVNNGKGKKTYLGLFSTEEKAHAAYRKSKAAVLRAAAKEQKDERVKEALLKRADELEVLLE